jgi:hypothetical protein
MRPWQEKVAWHHIDGNRHNNDRDNLRLVHQATGKPLSQQEVDNYCSYLQHKLCNLIESRDLHQLRDDFPTAPDEAQRRRE